MTAKGAGGLMPSILDIDAYVVVGGAFSIVTYQSKRRLKCEYAATDQNSVDPASEVDASQTWHWPVCAEACMTGSFDGSQTYIIFAELGGNHWLAYKKATTTTYKIALLHYDDPGWTEHAVSGSTYTQDVMLSFRGENQGTTAVKLWIDGTLELDTTATNTACFSMLQAHNGSSQGTYKLLSSPSQVLYWRGITGRHGSAESDRPGVKAEGSQLDAWANTDENDGTPQGQISRVNCVDDTDADGSINDDTDYVLFGNGSEFTLLSTLMSDGFAFSNDVSVHSVVVHHNGRAATSSKTCKFRHRIRDDDGTPNIVNGDLLSLITDVYISKNHVFTEAPDGGLWEDFLDSLGEFNGGGGTASAQNLEAGVLIDAGNNVNERTTSIVCEAMALDDDPPAAAEPSLPPALLDRRNRTLIRR